MEEGDPKDNCTGSAKATIWWEQRNLMEVIIVDCVLNAQPKIYYAALYCISN
jgi:hypothetical protein